MKKPMELRVIDFLREKGEGTVDEIAAVLGFDRSGVHRAIVNLRSEQTKIIRVKRYKVVGAKKFAIAPVYELGEAEDTPRPRLGTQEYEDFKNNHYAFWDSADTEEKRQMHIVVQPEIIEIDQVFRDATRQAVMARQV